MQKELTESVQIGKDAIPVFSFPSKIDGEEKTNQNKNKVNKVSVQEYRELVDTIATDEQIEQKLNYLEALCRNVIRAELETICRQKC